MTVKIEAEVEVYCVCGCWLGRLCEKTFGATTGGKERVLVIKPCPDCLEQAREKVRKALKRAEQNRMDG